MSFTVDPTKRSWSESIVPQSPRANAIGAGATATTTAVIAYTGRKILLDTYLTCMQSLDAQCIVRAEPLLVIAAIVLSTLGTAVFVQRYRLQKRKITADTNGKGHLDTSATPTTQNGHNHTGTGRPHRARKQPARLGFV